MIYQGVVRKETESLPDRLKIIGTQEQAIPISNLAVIGIFKVSDSNQVPCRTPE